MNYTKGEWRNWSAPNGYHIWAGDVHIADVGDKEDAEQSANANLIVEVVNACPVSYTHLTLPTSDLV